MASKFQIWVDDSHLNNVMDYSAFASDSQRQAGFTGGTPASSVRVNTALRQANLVACAMMNIVDPTGTKDFTAKVSDIQTLINTYLTTTLKTSQSTLADKATNADVTNLNTNANAIINFQIGNGTSFNKTINNVANVTTSINNKNITDIFESNGTTVKNSTNSINSTNATNAINATKAIVNNDNSYSGFIQDENNTLKTNDQVIGKIVDFNITKKDITADYTFTDLNFKFGDVIEIIYDAIGAGNASRTANVIYIPLLQYPSGSGVTNSTGQTYQLISRGNGNVFEFSIYVSVLNQSITMKKPTKILGSVDIGCSPTILKISKIIR